MPIRNIREGDFEGLRKLFLDYYEELDCEDDADELYEEYLIPDLKADLLSVAVWEEYGKLRAFIIYQIDDIINDWNFKEGFGDLREIYVIPSYRKKGIGKSLINYAENALKASGVKNLYVLPTEESEPFFIKCGYADLGDYCPEIDNKVFEKNL
ncbi:MAG: GNAT family N-acetyltransferase [Candidatus Coproplasma sp.]